MTDPTLQERVLESTPFKLVLGGQGSPTDGSKSGSTITAPKPYASYTKNQIYNATTCPHPNDFTIFYMDLTSGDLYVLNRPDSDGVYTWSAW